MVLQAAQGTPSSSSPSLTHPCCSLRAKEDPHTFLFCDVTGPENIQSMVDDVLRKYGRIDALINNGALAAPPLLGGLPRIHRLFLLLLDRKSVV